MKSYLLLFSILGLPFLTKAQNKKEDPALKGFDKYVEKVVKMWNIPGLAIGIVKDGEIIYTKGFGYKNVDKKEKVTVNTQFAIGSSSKAFTAMAIAQLVDDGLIEFDEPIKTYIPDFEMYDEYVTNHITARDLLCHRSGLPRHDFAWYGSDKTRAELIASLPYLEPSTDFRTSWQYQNLMFMTAGYLVEKVTGQTWEQYTKTHIFNPLKMNNSNFSVETMQKSNDYALAYKEEKEKIELMDFRNIDAIGPAGSINSTASDMCQWLKIQLGKGSFDDVDIVNQSSFTEMHKPHTVVPGRISYKELHYTTYGLGWFINSYRGHLMSEHGGNIDGFTAMVGLLPKDDIGVVILANKNGSMVPTIIRNNVFDRLLELEEVDWNDRFFAKMKEAKEKKKDREKEDEPEDILQKKNTKPSHNLKDYVGTYENDGYGKVIITEVDGILNLTLREFEVVLEHYHYDIFKGTNSLLNDKKIVFGMNVDGDIDAISVDLETGIEAIQFKKQIELGEISEASLEKYVGQYELAGTIITVESKEKTLFLTVPGQPTYTLEPSKEHTFNLKKLTGYSVIFKMNDGENKAAACIFNQPNGMFTANRKE